MTNFFYRMATVLTSSIGWPTFCGTSNRSREPTTVTTKDGSRIRSPEIVLGTRWFTICSRRRAPLPVRVRPVTCFGIRACLSTTCPTRSTSFSEQTWLAPNVTIILWRIGRSVSFTNWPLFSAPRTSATGIRERSATVSRTRIFPNRTSLRRLLPTWPVFTPNRRKALSFRTIMPMTTSNLVHRWSLCSLFGSREMKKVRPTKSTIRMPKPCGPVSPNG